MSDTDIAIREKKAIAVTGNRLADSLFSAEHAPHYMKLAGQLASSEIVPKCYRNKPADLFLCWAKGYQLGISPEEAMYCISVINGRPVMWGDEMLALCMSHPDFKDIVEEPLLDKNTVVGYRCTIKRKGKTDTVSVFTLEMAKKARLLNKPGPWMDYPERMLKLRARGFALRDSFPDALKGLKTREEVEDYIDADYTESKPGRTQILKKELTNANLDHAEIPVVENEPIREEGSQDSSLSGMDALGEEANQLHAEIARLIKDKGYEAERVRKALTYYGVEAIEEMDIESSKDFIAKLNK